MDAYLRAQFPKTYVSRRYAHWRTLYRLWQWVSIPAKKASRWKQVPNSWKRGFNSHKRKLKGFCAEKVGLHPALESLVVQQIQALTEGDRLFQRAEPVTKADVCATVQTLVESVNARTEEAGAQVELSNNAAAAQFVSGALSFGEFAAALQEKPTPVSCTDIKHMVRGFLKKGGFTKQSVNTAGLYLEDDDPRMLAQL